jgi:hypothetical protein
MQAHAYTCIHMRAHAPMHDDPRAHTQPCALRCSYMNIHERPMRTHAHACTPMHMRASAPIRIAHTHIAHGHRTCQWQARTARAHASHAERACRSRTRTCSRLARMNNAHARRTSHVASRMSRMHNAYALHITHYALRITHIAQRPWRSLTAHASRTRKSHTHAHA